MQVLYVTVQPPVGEHLPQDIRARAQHARASKTIWLLWATYLLWVGAILFVPRDFGQYQEGTFSGAYRLLNFLIYLPVLLMLLIAVRTLFHPPREYIHSQANQLALLLLGVLVVMLTVGVVGSPNPLDAVRALWLETLPVFAMLLFLNGRDLPMARQSLFTLVALQAAIGALLVAFVLAVYPVVESRGQVTGAHAMAFALTSPASLAILLLPALRPWQRVAAVAGYVAAIALSLSYQGRLQAIIQIGLMPVAYIFVQMRLGTVGVAVKRAVVPLAGVGVLAIGVVAWSPAVRAQVEAGLEGTLSRVSGTRSLYESRTSSDPPEERWIEAAEFVKTATWRTWLIGEGFGGTWRSAHMSIFSGGNQWPMVHFGPLHLVLKGGLPFLLTFHLLYALVMYRLWRTSRHSILCGAVLAYACIAYIGFLSHGPMLHRYSTYFTWTLLGVAFASSVADQGSSSLRRSRNRRKAKLAEPHTNVR
jgi:hypothetical protein